jgi:alanyl-tRNA synthetase
MASTQEKAQEATSQAKDAAQQAGQQAKSRVSEELDRRSSVVGEQATSIAEAIRKAAQQLHQEGKDSAAKPMEQAAERVESMGRWLREADGDRMLGEVEDFGRRKPGAVLAGGLLVGFALSRLLKASSTQRYQSMPSRTRPTYGGNGGGTPQLSPPVTTPPITTPPTTTSGTTPGAGTTPGTGATRSY